MTRRGSRRRIRNAIRLLRLQNGDMTQQALADRVGITRQTVIAMEQNRYSPSLETAFRIAEVFSVPLETVFQYPLGDAEDGP
jgi:putative transcriptional regulator